MGLPGKLAKTTPGTLRYYVFDGLRMKKAPQDLSQDMLRAMARSKLAGATGRSGNLRIRVMQILFCHPCMTVEAVILPRFVHQTASLATG
jgi:hypothetical protein